MKAGMEELAAENAGGGGPCMGSKPRQPPQCANHALGAGSAR